MSQDIKGLTVFVVDDESIIATTLGMVLRQGGFEARSFDLPLEALQAAREMAPDLLISDVLMPILSGIELAIQMREDCPNCRVLLFSGNPGAADMLKTAGAGGSSFEILAKPIHPRELLEKVRAVMDA